jgi:SAM-dependent methyltransferase
MAAQHRGVDTPRTKNIDAATVASFGDEWARFDQSELSETEGQQLFDGYFRLFPWHALPPNAEGFDMGCGSGRWARHVAPRIGMLHCVDPAPDALAIARRNLREIPNVDFLNASTDTALLPLASQDFGYSLGVLHHVPDTGAALRSCTRYLKPGAPFLLYLYYSFENRPPWFRVLWRASEALRAVISSLPSSLKPVVTDAIAVTAYWPLARLAWLGERVGIPVQWMPLSFYRDKSIYTMRTDSRDRFGTPLEHRFSREEIHSMMLSAGLRDIVISDSEPYWCAVGTKA